jgi:maleylacetoacetate isomerase/maleylpyruvate isomerase
MKLYGFWRSLATYRVRAALALKGLKAEEISIDLLQGRQLDPSYMAINPEGVLPTLVLDDGTRLVQSMAILEYLEETHPRPPLLPADPAGRARVRGLAQIVVSDGHPFVTPRVRIYLEERLHQDEAARHRWMVHWTQKACEAVEGVLAGTLGTGRLCHGDTPTFADLCLASHVIGMVTYLKAPPVGVPTVMRIFEAAMAIPAFDRAHPLKQPGAPGK